MPLPETLTSAGRPVWEPPILDYSMYIGEEYEKQREGLLKYHNGDVVKTTEFLDLWVEFELLFQYKMWATCEEPLGENKRHDGFFRELCEDIFLDVRSALDKFLHLGVLMRRNEDGTYHVSINLMPDCPVIPRALPLLKREKRIPKDGRKNITLPDPPVQSPQIREVVGHGLPLVASSSLPPATPQMSVQPHTEAMETTPLLSTARDTEDEDSDDPSAVIMCACPCS